MLTPLETELLAALRIVSATYDCPTCGDLGTCDYCKRNATIIARAEAKAAEPALITRLLAMTPVERAVFIGRFNAMTPDEISKAFAKAAEPEMPVSGDESEPMTQEQFTAALAKRKSKSDGGIPKGLEVSVD